MAPALPQIAHDMNTTLETANMSLSIFVLAFAFGPMILAPFTEVFGRRNVWLLCSSWYVVWNMTCGFARSKGLLVAARLLAGMGSSVEYVVSLMSKMHSHDPLALTSIADWQCSTRRLLVSGTTGLFFCDRDLPASARSSHRAISRGSSRKFHWLALVVLDTVSV